MKQSKLLLDWLNSKSLTPADRQTLLHLDPQSQAKQFKQLIKMNSSGWRRPLALGSDSFNLYTIKQIACAWFELLKQTHAEGKVLIFADQRHLSQKAKALCVALAKRYNFTVYTTNYDDRFAPTPFLTYLLQHFAFIGGMMITASHCFANYNGCKLFDHNGIGLHQKALRTFHQLLRLNALRYLNTTFTYQTPHFLSSFYKDSYFKTQAAFLDRFAKKPKVISLFFSALHGTTANWTDKFLQRRKFKLLTVPLQHDFDPNFKTLQDPNPEHDQTFNLLKATANKNNALANTLLITQDCDGDRVRIAVKTAQTWKLFHGNEIATIIVYFFLNELQWNGTIYRSWVSTPLIDRIAAQFQQTVVTTDTGPTNLALAYTKKAQDFLFAFEESLGFLPSLKVNSYKDGIFTAQTIAEIANYLVHQKNQNLATYLEKIYHQFNHYSYAQFRFDLTKEQLLLPNLLHVIQKWDKIGLYKITNRQFLPNQTKFRLLILKLGNQAQIALRFSATEPIFKVYFTVINKLPSRAEQIMDKIKIHFRQKIAKMKKSC